VQALVELEDRALSAAAVLDHPLVEVLLERVDAEVLAVTSGHEPAQRDQVPRASALRPL
jgi:hypothetical protein